MFVKLFLASLATASASVGALRDVAAPKHMNFTSFTDGTCATRDTAKKVLDFKVGECKKMTIALCDATGTNATLVYYNDATCTSFNSSKSYVSGACTPSGPKTARKGKIATCY